MTLLEGTENLRDLYDFEGRKQNFNKALIVAGSGDQTLEAIFHGAKYINTFDANRLAYYGASLKYAARKALDYDEFMAFYCLYFPDSLYNKVKRYLSPDVAYFWGALFARHKNEAIFDYLFNSANHDEINGEKHISVYFKEEYETMRRKLLEAQISFTETNLLNIHSKSIGKEKYNFIYLSNIFQYLGISIDEYVDFLKRSLIPLLDREGRIVLDYSYKRYANIDEAMSEANCFSELCFAVDDIERFQNF